MNKIFDLLIIIDLYESSLLSFIIHTGLKSARSLILKGDTHTK